MARTCGTVVRGLRSPILREGDDLTGICVDILLSAAQKEGFSIDDNDILGVTEAVLARTQGNYATTRDIARDIDAKFNDSHIGLIFPIMSRNRFSMILKGVALTNKKITIQLSYPSDEVGNPLVTMEQIIASSVNPWSDVFTADEFIDIFGECKHPFTHVDYIDMYRNIGNTSIIMANNPTEILKHTKSVLVCDIHTRGLTKEILRKAGAKTLYALDEILNTGIDGSGHNPQFGLLGSNTANDTQLKLFPRDADKFVNKVKELIFQKTGKSIEVLVYGDGGFKDPVAFIWELADPVISPGFTEGLAGLPNETKIKYLADSKFANLSGDALNLAIKDHLKTQSGDALEKGGTTPRRIVDLVGSLCDLTSGSGSKGTPFVFIKGYFDHLGNE
ncbi:MAG: coenzyme F420-0:L-glutamate ligase [Clostridiales bacterium]|nr:coenzyme F420-0:L-glutamate ligase [Clostridiales bacterium]